MGQDVDSDAIDLRIRAIQDSSDEVVREKTRLLKQHSAIRAVLDKRIDQLERLEPDAEVALALNLDPFREFLLGRDRHEKGALQATVEVLATETRRSAVRHHLGDIRNLAEQYQACALQVIGALEFKATTANANRHDVRDIHDWFKSLHGLLEQLGDALDTNSRLKPRKRCAGKPAGLPGCCSAHATANEIIAHTEDRPFSLQEIDGQCVPVFRDGTQYPNSVNCLQVEERTSFEIEGATVPFQRVEEQNVQPLLDTMTAACRRVRSASLKQSALTPQEDRTLRLLVRQLGLDVVPHLGWLKEQETT